MQDLIAALQSLDDAIRSSFNLVLPIINLIVTSVLALLVYLQNKRQDRNNTQLQTDQFKKDALLRRYDSIFEIFISFGQVLRYKNEKQIMYSLQVGDRGRVLENRRELAIRLNAMLPNIDLARLLFGGTDDAIIELLEQQHLKQKAVCNLYADYAIDHMTDICTEAWKKVHQLYSEIPMEDQKALRSNNDAYNVFMKLTSNEKLSEIEKEFDEIKASLLYENFDVYFAKYLRISEICK